MFKTENYDGFEFSVEILDNFYRSLYDVITEAQPFFAKIKDGWGVYLKHHGGYMFATDFVVAELDKLGDNFGTIKENPIFIVSSVNFFFISSYFTFYRIQT